VAAVGGGCATALPPPREAIPADAQRAVDLLAANWQGFSDLRTLAAVTVDRRGKRQQLSGALLARRPSALRFEALSPFGAPFMFLNVADGQLRGYNAATNEAVVGPATPEVTAKLLSLPFDPDDLVSVLAGLAAPSADLRTAELLPAETFGPSVMLYGAVNRKRVWMDMTTGVVRQQEIVGGRYAVRVTYTRNPDGALTGFSFDAAESQVTGTVRYQEPVFGGGIDPARFAFTIPRGARIKNLE
jgi:outer membrane lipoprotein-sorting protein